MALLSINFERYLEDLYKSIIFQLVDRGIEQYKIAGSGGKR
jgi:hypothetical protein